MIDAQMREGIRKAMVIKNKTANKVSVDAGYNQNQVARFLAGDNDIQLMTLQALCVKGLGMSFNDILILGQMEK